MSAKVPSIEVLAAELKKHDWYYDYSDDHRVYSAGCNHWRKIRLLVLEAAKESGEAAVRAVWEENANKEFAFPGIREVVSF